VVRIERRFEGLRDPDEVAVLLAQMIVAHAMGEVKPKPVHAVRWNGV